MKSQQIKHVFFDLDHTLYDFETNSAKALEVAFENLALQKRGMLIDDFLPIYVPINKALWDLYRDNLITQDELRYRRFKDSFSKLNFYIADLEISQLSDLYINELPNFASLFPFTHDVLQELQNSYKLHIITNGFESVQLKKMQQANINQYFSTVTHSESVGYKKPDVRIYNYALQMAQANASESIMIGDCEIADYNGALNAGLHALLFDPENLSNVNQKITCLSQIPKRL
jgi:putative hydrolase of the HAD superfamily